MAIAWVTSHGGKDFEAVHRNLLGYKMRFIQEDASGADVDPRRGRVVVFSALDNRRKDAAGSAIQNMNCMLGLPEETGLTAAGLHRERWRGGASLRSRRTAPTPWGRRVANARGRSTQHRLDS